jgi:hypothetical protein
VAEVKADAPARHDSTYRIVPQVVLAGRKVDGGIGGIAGLQIDAAGMDRDVESTEVANEVASGGVKAQGSKRAVGNNIWRGNSHEFARR